MKATTALRRRATHTQRGTLYRSLPGWGWWIVGGGMLLGLFSPQPFLSLACWGALPFLVRMTWRGGEPPIAVYGIVLLWVNAAGQVIYFSGFLGHPLRRVFGGPELETAIWLTLGGCLVVAVGFRIGMWRVPNVSWKRLKEEAQQLDMRKLLLGYGVAYAASSFLNFGSVFSLGGLAQAVLALKLIRWMFFFLLAFAVLVQRRQYSLLIGATAIEVILGLIGFWGGFKDFFPLFAIAYVTARPRLSWRKGVSLFAVFAIILYIGLFWTAVKGEYRAFLTQGRRTQVVVVPVEAQVEKLMDLATSTDASEVWDATDAAVRRVAYVDHFADVVEYIPRYRPYDGGRGWWKGIMHILKPRLFFPNKPAINDSDITRKYTGEAVAGAEQGTSISIGYIGESYADFGPIWMFVPIFGVGVMYTLMYRFFITQSEIKLVGFAIAVSFLPTQIGAQPSVPRLLGTSITNFVVMAALLWLGGPTLYRWLRD